MSHGVGVTQRIENAAERPSSSCRALNDPTPLEKTLAAVVVAIVVVVVVLLATRRWDSPTPIDEVVYGPTVFNKSEVRQGRGSTGVSLWTSTNRTGR